MKKKNDTTYHDDVMIQKGALDEQWERQPVLFLKWAERHAEALIESERAKTRMDVVKAELDKAMRLDPASFEMVKVTETAIDLAIRSHPKYVKAVEEYQDARLDALFLQAARDALWQKKEALENLTRLYCMGMTASPKAMWEEQSQVHTKALNE